MGCGWIRGDPRRHPERRSVLLVCDRRTPDTVECRTRGKRSAGRGERQCNRVQSGGNCARIGVCSLPAWTRSDRTARSGSPVRYPICGQRVVDTTSETSPALRASLRGARLNPSTSSRSGCACLSVSRTIGRAKLNPLAGPGSETNPPVFWARTTGKSRKPPSAVRLRSDAGNKS